MVCIFLLKVDATRWHGRAQQKLKLSRGELAQNAPTHIIMLVWSLATPPAHKGSWRIFKLEMWALKGPCELALKQPAW